MRIGICDDDPRDCRALREIIDKLRGDDEIECFPDSAALLEALRGGAEFSCLFLDILMPGVNGIELAAKIRELQPAGRRPFLVFVTSSPNFAVEAFAYRAAHYILKPLREADVAEALSRVSERPETRLGVMVKTRTATRLLYLDEIALCESELHALHIRLMTGEVVDCNQTIESLRTQLGEGFLLISRGILVNAAYIEKMETRSCVLKDGRRILLSRGNLARIHEDYNSFIFSRLIDQK